MKIIFSPYFSSHPYWRPSRRDDNGFGVVVCGPDSLLTQLQLHAGLYYPAVPAGERQAEYFKHFKRLVNEFREGKGHHEMAMIEKSFAIDEFGVSNAVLSWRDSLVESGWTSKDADGIMRICGNIPEPDRKKLDLVKAAEPLYFPKGKADQWADMSAIARERPVLPSGTSIDVDIPEKYVPFKYRYVLEGLASHGVSVCYPSMESLAGEDSGTALSRIRKRLVESLGASGKEPDCSLDIEPDGSFWIYEFPNESKAMRYLAASQQQDDARVYLTSNMKKFDNVQRMLGQAESGAAFNEGVPAVVKLFRTGNSLFSVPSDIRTMVSWLSSSISPVPMRKLLLKALVDDGGFGTDWQAAVELCRKDAEGKRTRYDKFLPVIRTKADVTVGRVMQFNSDMAQWAGACSVLMSDDGEYVYDELTRKYLLSLSELCSAMKSVLAVYGTEGQVITLRELMNICDCLEKGKKYGYMPAAKDSRMVITTAGDMASNADSLVFMGTDIADTPCNGTLDFLSDKTVNELKSAGLRVITREEASLYDDFYKMLPVLKTGQLIWVVYNVRQDGTAVNPVYVFINSLFRDDKDRGRFVRREFVLDDSLLEQKEIADNGKSPEEKESHFLILEEGCGYEKLKPGSLDATDKEKNSVWTEESYSGIDKLVSHPFDYLCESIGMKDQDRIKVDRINTVRGNVFHRFFELYFSGAGGDDKDALFEKVINENGLLLRAICGKKDMEIMKRQVISCCEDLSGFIQANSLKVLACEKTYGPVEWSEASEKYRESFGGEGTGKILLKAKIDMLLEDAGGNCVVIDYKWKEKSSSFEKTIEEGRALQLALYSYVISKSSAKAVRTAYYVVPDGIMVTGCDFSPSGDFRIRKVKGYDPGQIMREAVNSFVFRWGQIKSGRIERSEGEKKNDVPYEKERETKPMLALAYSAKNELYEGFDDYKKLK